MKHIFSLPGAALLAVTLASCGSEKAHPEWSDARCAMEERGQIWLARSRQALAEGRFDDARQAIDSLRRTCDLAFDARHEGILLMDSIDIAHATAIMQKAADSLAAGVSTKAEADSLQQVIDENNQKCEFYTRKLRHDKERK